MKKIILLLSILTVSITSWSQTERRHEIKIDALGALVVPSLEISYEYAMNVHSGIGVASYFRLDPPSDDYRTFSIAPYYRQYFYDNQSYGNKGFFIEAQLQYSSGKDEKEIINEALGIPDIKHYNDIGVGFGGGVKWVTPNGFTVEAGAGVGRNFKLDKNSPDFFFNWGINLGYRFF